MSYVDGILDREKDRIHVVERDKDGKRFYTDYPSKLVFYYSDPNGKFKSIYGNPVTRVQCKTSKEFRKEVSIHSSKKTWETDINPIFRCLEEYYKGKEAPKLHTAFFDIETDFDQERGFSGSDEAFNPITAITIYLDWMEKVITLVIPPKSMSDATAQEIAGEFSDTYIFHQEADLLDTFLGLIDDADILSGWNSEGFDIPYIVNRITRVLSKDDTRRLCLWGQYPRKREFERYGARQITFDTVGRVHLDYMQLYRKYTYHEMHSYSLDAIGEYELGERKVAYEGTLDQLYNKNFKKFVDYNRQDTMLLAKLDRKLRFIDLSNELAHANTVLLQTTMGAVAVTEQAIINEAHERGFVVPDRKNRDELTDVQAAGAYVATPKRGMHEYIGAIDIKSLYPNTLRSCNMALETIVGQLRPIATDKYINDQIAKGKSFAEAWDGLFGSLEYTSVMNKEIGTNIVIDWEETGEETIHSAAEVWDMIFNSNQNWILTANGTIITTEKEGIVPGLLARWYHEREELQAKKAVATTPEEKAFWDKRQLVKKINLNSLYGAILNPGCRFFDKRIGQSTTLTGRVIARHMDAYVNECITGKYDYIGDAIIYGDTDSVYFSAWPIIKAEVEAGKLEWSREVCRDLYDQIANNVNESFPKFMADAFHCPPAMGSLISGGRELIASKGLFIKKKRYAVLIYDLEGKRLDIDGNPGKVKAMGLDLKRADTPKDVQDFLSDILLDVLTGKEKQVIFDKIKLFKTDFAKKPPWEKGTPKRVNNLTEYGKKEERQGKANMPGHVRAAINWNNLKKMHNDNYSMKIVDGMKVIVCKLKENALGLTSVAYPTDSLHLPEWFKELPFDPGLMEITIVDQKIENLLGVLNWNIADYTETTSTFGALFEFQ